MKRLFSLLLMVFSITLAEAQVYEPNTKWPYLYENFTEGTIFFEGNHKSQTRLNIHLLGNVLHYLDASERVMQFQDKGITRVEIGSDVYIFSNHKLMKVLTEENHNLVVMSIEADFDALTQGTGAYGSSLNSSASRNLSSLDLGGIDMPELGRLLQNRNDGRVLPLRSRYFFVVYGKQVEASKKGAESLLNAEGLQDWKAFLKQSKIKWKDCESLGNVLHYINEHGIAQ